MDNIIFSDESYFKEFNYTEKCWQHFDNPINIELK